MRPEPGGERVSLVLYYMNSVLPSKVRHGVRALGCGGVVCMCYCGFLFRGGSPVFGPTKNKIDLYSVAVGVL